MSALDPRRSRQVAWLITATRALVRMSSISSSVRPSSARAPSTSKKVPETAAKARETGPSCCIRLSDQFIEPVAASPVNDVFCVCQSRKSRYDTSHTDVACPGARSHITTTRVGSSSGRGRNRTPYATAKTAMFAPSPTARIAAVVSAVCRSRRTKRMACAMASGSLGMAEASVAGRRVGRTGASL